MVTNIDVANFISTNQRWSSPLTPLILVPSIVFVHRAQFASTTKAPILSRLVRAHTYVKSNWCGLWYPYLLGSLEISTFLNRHILICKIYSIKIKFCKMAFAAIMWTYTWACLRVYCACVYRGVCACICGICLLRNIDSNLSWLKTHWLKVEPKQSILLFKYKSHSCQ